MAEPADITRNRIQIQALMDGFDIDNSPNRELLKHADIIIAWDTDTEHQRVMYGLVMLKGIEQSGKGLKGNVVTIELDQETAELDWLIAAVKDLKGSCDFGY